MLVKSGGKMDLKRQPEWQHSAFIYDGELVDKDVPGNINYGYFGEYCNIPLSPLLVGAGLAQLVGGKTKMEYWYVFLDEPRDTYRVMQGIDIYNEWYHPLSNS